MQLSARAPRLALLAVLSLWATSHAAPLKAPSSAYIPNLSFESQTWNNCGPASVVGVLGAYGYRVSQAEAKQVLRPTGEGYMTADVIDAYVQPYGLRATRFTGGRLEHIKRTIDLGVPVLVLQWLRGRGSGKTFVGEIPHFRTVRGYDDKAAQFWINDPLLGANVVISYADFITLWSVYNNEFIPVYPQTMKAQLERAIGVKIPRS